MMNNAIGSAVDFLQSHAAWLRGLYEDVTTSLWFRPMFWMFGMGILATLMVAADQTDVGNALRDLLPDMLLGDTASVRTMLGAIAGAMLTVTSLSFTLMMSTVVQTANAYTPRLLRQYIGDPQNQHVLGILLGTFLYSVLVLFSIRGGERVFVPIIASNVALLLSIVSIIAFVSFLNHAASSIKVGSIITLIVSATQDVIGESFPNTLGQAWEGESAYRLPESEPSIVCSKQTGYIQIYNLQELFEVATEHDLTIEVISLVGDFLLKGTPVMRVWHYRSEAVSQSREEKDDQILEVARSAYIVNRERTESQDIRFGFRQLSDIALRALSPGINDPTTAISAIHSIAALLSMVIENDEMCHMRCDENGKPRIILPEQTFQELLNEAFIQIRHYGIEDFLVVSTLLEMCGKIALTSDSGTQRESLWQFVITTAQEADKVIVTPAERERINRALRESAENLNHDPQPYLLALQKEIHLPSSLV